jgi:hypothetical protein
VLSKAGHYFLDVVFRAEKNRRSLVNTLHFDVQNVDRTGVRQPPSLTHHKSHRFAFVHDPQLPIGSVFVRRVHKYPSVLDGSVDVSHHGTHVPQRVRFSLGGKFLLQDKLLNTVFPLIRITLVYRIDATLLGNFDVLVGQQKLSDLGVEEESVDSLPRGQNQHGGGAVEGVTCSYNPIPGVQSVFYGRNKFVVFDHNREDRSDGDQTIDIGEAVERVERHDVLALLVLVHFYNVLVFFGDHDPHRSRRCQDVDEDLVSQSLQFLRLFRLGVAGTEQRQPCPPDCSADGFYHDLDRYQEIGEFAGGSPVLALFLQDEAREGQTMGVHRRRSAHDGIADIWSLEARVLDLYRLIVKVSKLSRY